MTPRLALIAVSLLALALEPSERTDFPPWLAFYPDAKIIVANAPPLGWKPQSPADMRTYKIELNSTASVAQVAAFYKETILRHGLTIASESQSEERHYALEARSADRMHVVYLNVHRRPGGAYVSLLDHYTLPRP